MKFTKEGEKKKKESEKDTEKEVGNQIENIKDEANQIENMKEVVVPAWVNPQWRDDDLFALTKPELDVMKARAAEVMSFHWRGVHVDKPYAMEVAGVAPLTDGLGEKRAAEYKKASRRATNSPSNLSGVGRIAFVC